MDELQDIQNGVGVIEQDAFSIFLELKRRVEIEGAIELGEIRDLIDELVLESEREGRLGEDANTEQLRADVETMWKESTR